VDFILDDVRLRLPKANKDEKFDIVQKFVENVKILARNNKICNTRVRNRNEFRNWSWRCEKMTVCFVSSPLLIKNRYILVPTSEQRLTTRQTRMHA
jgi:hypothetical protein